MYKCKVCGYRWKGRKTRFGNKYPKRCPSRACQSQLWRIGDKFQSKIESKPVMLDYEDATNLGGQEWHQCMYFDDTKDVIEVCGERGYNIATIEVPLGVVDVSWRSGIETRPAAHPSERGCYITMPLVLCQTHVRLLAYIQKENIS